MTAFVTFERLQILHRRFDMKIRDGVSLLLILFGALALAGCHKSTMESTAASRVQRPADDSTQGKSNGPVTAAPTNPNSAPNRQGD